MTSNRQIIIYRIGPPPSRQVFSVTIRHLTRKWRSSSRRPSRRRVERNGQGLNRSQARLLGWFPCPRCPSWPRRPRRRSTCRCGDQATRSSSQVRSWPRSSRWSTSWRRRSWPRSCRRWVASSSPCKSPTHGPSTAPSSTASPSCHPPPTSSIRHPINNLKPTAATPQTTAPIDPNTTRSTRKNWPSRSNAGSRPPRRPPCISSTTIKRKRHRRTRSAGTTTRKARSLPRRSGATFWTSSRPSSRKSSARHRRCWVKTRPQSLEASMPMVQPHRPSPTKSTRDYPRVALSCHKHCNQCLVCPTSASQLAYQSQSRYLRKIWARSAPERHLKLSMSTTNSKTSRVSFKASSLLAI